MTTLNKWVLPAAVGAIAALTVVAVLSFSGNNAPSTKNDTTYTEHMRDNYRVFALPLPDSILFAGERVPMNIADVSERMDRELLVNTYWHSNTLLSIKRANRWFPVIEPILKEEGIPDDFKYLSLIESGFLNAKSPSDAIGFWQFLDGTAREFGMEVNDVVDERYDVRKSTRAACAYFKQAYAKYGSWTTAAGSYNMGMNGMDEQTTRQRTSNYWSLLLNEETSRYVSRILALKEVMNRADQYGFVIRPQDLYAPYQCNVITVDTSINDLVSFANGFGLDYKTFKIHNPWLRQSYLKNKTGKRYEMLIPQ